MAQNYEIDIKRFNGQDYDTLLPTPAAHASTHQADGSDPLTLQTGNYGGASIPTSAYQDASVTRAKLASDAKVLSFTDKTVATSSWASDTTYPDFPYRASVACSGVTANHYADVSFSPADVLEGIFCPVAVSYAGGVYIYASEKPSATVTIPTIVCTPIA